MYFEFLNGTTQQKAWAQECIDALRVPTGSYADYCSIKFVADPTETSQDELGATTSDPEKGISHITLLSDLDSRGKTTFFSVLAHEIGHAYFETLSAGTKAALASFFGRPSWDGGAWEERPQEACACHFEASALPSELRNPHAIKRTKLRIITEERWNEWLNIVSQERSWWDYDVSHFSTAPPAGSKTIQDFLAAVPSKSGVKALRNESNVRYLNFVYQVDYWTPNMHAEVRQDSWGNTSYETLSGVSAPTEWLALHKSDTWVTPPDDDQVDFALRDAGDTVVETGISIETFVDGTKVVSTKQTPTVLRNFPGRVSSPFASVEYDPIEVQHPLVRLGFVEGNFDIHYTFLPADENDLLDARRFAPWAYTVVDGGPVLRIVRHRSLLGALPFPYTSWAEGSIVAAPGPVGTIPHRPFGRRRPVL